jgi:hypothetical protein
MSSGDTLMNLVQNTLYPDWEYFFYLSSVLPGKCVHTSHFVIYSIHKLDAIQLSRQRHEIFQQPKKQPSNAVFRSFSHLTSIKKCFFAVSNQWPTPKWSGAQIFQKSRSYLKILGAGRVRSSRFHTQNPQILGATLQNVVARITSRLVSVFPYPNKCKSDVWLAVHRNSMWIRNQLDVTFVLSFTSLLQVAQHVSGNHVPIFRSW